MNSVISTYESADYTFFTFAGIRSELNKDGVEKKKPIGMPNWREVNKSNYKQYINQDHHGLAIICGAMSGITIFDFDNADEYDKLILSYPELKQYKSIKTRKGYHIYCKYDASVLTTTNAFVNISGVDIRNDASVVFAPPTKYKLLDGSITYYEDLGGIIQSVPEFLLKELKQNNKSVVVQTQKSLIKVKENKEQLLTSEPNNILNKNQELLKLVKIEPKDRTTWLRVCSCIKHNNMSNDDWLNFCKNNNLNMDTEKENLYKNIKLPYAFDIHYLQSLAKNSNSVEYKKWLQKWNVYFITQEQANDPFSASEVIVQTLKQTLKLCKENWYMLSENQLWKQQKEPSYYIIKEMHKYLDTTRECLNRQITETEGEAKQIHLKKLEIWLKHYNNISKPSYLSVLTKCLRPLLADDCFAEKLDCNKGLLAFKNGIMDLETKTFREGILWCDFITQTIPYDYVPSDFNYTKSVLKKILNNNDEHLEYFLSILGYSFIGQPDLEKSIYFMIDKTENGKGDNGKTFFFDILNELMPNYVYRTKSSLIENNNSKVHKQLVMTKGKRLVWLEELPKEKDTNAELMKEIGDGKQLENEVMFGTSETINVMFKMFALSNHTPKINANETAVFNRYKQVSFNSHFDRTGIRTIEIPDELKFIADTSLSTTIKEIYYNEVFNLIIHYANMYYKRKLPPVPHQFLKDTNETQAKNDEFGSWFDENCVVDESGKSALKYLVSVTGMNIKLVKEGLERKGYKYQRDLSGLGKDEFNKPFKGGYVGFKIIECIEEIDDNQ